MDQKLYWDGVAKDKTFTTPFRLDLLSKFISRDSRILDYGCGYGRTLSILIENGYENLVGVDISDQMIERGRQLLPGVCLMTNHDNEIPFGDGSFDAVLMLAVLTCVYDDNNLDKLLKEARRVLKPGGVLYVNDFLLNEDARNLQRYEQYEQQYGVYGVFEIEGGAVVRHFQRDRLHTLFSEFDKLFFAENQYTTMNGNRSNGFTFIGEMKRKAPSGY
jgi:ubiquinone/menaquinone biosynthesis C-methylase UbiE